MPTRRRMQLQRSSPGTSSPLPSKLLSSTTPPSANAQTASSRTYRPSSRLPASAICIVLSRPRKRLYISTRSLHGDESVNGISPTTPLPSTIEKVEIIVSTTALNSYAEMLLNAYQANTGHRVSTLEHLENVTLWCDRWYTTLVPDYCCDESRTDASGRNMVQGREGKENDALQAGRYGEHWSCKPYMPLKENERAEKEMRTGLKMAVNMSLEPHASEEADEVEKKAKPCIWSSMENAGIEVVSKPGNKRGWRK